MIPADSSSDTFHTELFLCTGDVYGAQAGYSVHVTTVADGRWHTVRMDLTSSGCWAGTIHEIRFDFFSSCTPEDRMYVKELKLLVE